MEDKLCLTLVYRAFADLDHNTERNHTPTL